MGNSGFSNSSTGIAPDRVNVVAICRSDLQLEGCRNCIQNAGVEILRYCPLSREAILWTESCTLRYSNESFFGTSAHCPGRLLVNTTNTTSIQQFNSDLIQLFIDLRSQATAGNPLIKVAAGNHSRTNFSTIYSLWQCTPDISVDNCLRCLDYATAQILSCCNGRQGVRLLLPSCMVRYEVFPFFNLTRIQQIQASLFLSPTPPSPSTSSPLPQTPLPPGNSRRIIIAIIAVAVTTACIVLGGCVFCILRRNQHKKTNEDEIIMAESLIHEYDKIRAATNDFSQLNELGRGGFGAVYKGILENGLEIAVKRLSKNSTQGDVEFKNEVFLLAKLHHRNLVRLIGYAIHGTERLLINEFVKNGSLDHFIFDHVKRNDLDWGTRYKIIRGIAKGLVYLHEDLRYRIIHRDLKPSNVLLDDEMNPKIADFGLARLFTMDETHGSTSKVAGTYGYMPPEYAFLGQLSVKIDVFSFGVLSLEIITGQKNTSFKIEDKAEGMLSYAWRSWRNGTTESMIDPILKGGSGSLQDMLRCIHITLLCVQEDAAKRPTMTYVVLMLNSSSVNIPIPSRPAFFMRNTLNCSSFGLSESIEAEAEGDENMRNDQSKNEASISDFYPR